MKKPIFYTELTYVFGTIFLAFGTALMTKANFGVSMVVAPAYLIHLKLSPIFSFITFGAAEYMLQAVLLIIIAFIMKRFKLSYLFSFITAIIYGFTLDGSLALVSLMQTELLWVRILFFIIGLPMTALGVALFFKTYISPAAYELFVKEVSSKMGIDIHKFKTGYDCVSCVISIIMSFAFFGLFKFEGINIGTVICALLNGKIINIFSKFMEKRFEFADALPFRKYFEK